MSLYTEIVKECDDALKKGRPQFVAKRLADLNAARVPREWRLPLAQICRRAGLESLGMKLLIRLIRPRNDKEGITATPAERAEYAVLLLRTGALNESAQLLEDLDARLVPEAYLYRSFYRFHCFDFAGAIPELEAYVGAQRDPYSRLVGQVNLAFAQVSAGVSGALSNVEEALAKAQENGHARLSSNCQALRAQLLIKQGLFSEAHEALGVAQALLAQASTHDRAFILKWRAFLEGRQARTVEPILLYRQAAAVNEDWDGVREADFHSLCLSFEPWRFNHLIFGTPFQAYREQICRELGRRPEQTQFVFGNPAAPCFDLVSCEIDGKPVLNAGRKSHQLVDVLLRDLYRPLRVGGLFSEIFPEEYFDIYTSPDRIHQLIRRTRRWLEASGVPVKIASVRGKYSLHIESRPGADVSFRIPLHRHPVDFMSLHFEDLKQKFSDASVFSAKEAKLKTGLSRTSVQRLINWALENGKIEKVGEKNSTAYRLCREPGVENPGGLAAA